MQLPGIGAAATRKKKKNDWNTEKNTPLLFVFFPAVSVPSPPATFADAGLPPTETTRHQDDVVSRGVMRFRGGETGAGHTRGAGRGERGMRDESKC
jgi:hypothetical protein